ncbi:hypothetical protein YC2023_107626 [Brassica napus]
MCLSRLIWESATELCNSGLPDAFQGLAYNVLRSMMYSIIQGLSERKIPRGKANEIAAGTSSTYNEGSNDGPSTLLRVPGLVNLVKPTAMLCGHSAPNLAVCDPITVSGNGATADCSDCVKEVPHL